MSSEEEWKRALMKFFSVLCKDIKEKINPGLTEEEFEEIVLEAIRKADITFHSPCFWEEIKSDVKPESMLELVKEIGKTVVTAGDKDKYSSAELLWALKTITLGIMIEGLMDHLIEILKQKKQSDEDVT